MDNAASLSGTVLDGKYAVDTLLGEGGMGAVYRARHVGTKRTVALKVIVPRMTGSVEFVERFRREAESAGGLRHPNVVDVTDFGFARVGGDEIAYLVMEYLDGCTLAEVLDEEKALTLDWVVDIVEQTCSAVDEAHRRGIVHRDLKPQNIWLEPNRRGGYTVKVLDFGLAKIHEQGPKPVGRFSTGALPKLSEILPAAEGATVAIGSGFDAAGMVAESGGSGSQLTQVGTVLGTPYYMSPEQCRALSTVDARSDVYSIAVIAYEMLAGQRPFSGSSVDVMIKHLTAEPPDLATVAPSVPKRVSEWVMSGLAKDADARPQTASLFASTLAARAEGVGALLRRALVICSENLGLFLRLFAIAYAPLFGLRVVKMLFSVFAARRLPGNVVFAWDAVVGVILTGMTVFVSLGISRGLTSLVLAQLSAVPLQKVRIREALGVVRRRARSLVLGSLPFLLLIMIPLALFVGSMNKFAEEWASLQAAIHVGAPTSVMTTKEVVGGVALLVAIASLATGFTNLVSYSLFPIALSVEGAGVGEALRRSRTLVNRARGLVTPVTLLEMFDTVVPLTLGFVFVAFVRGKIANDIAVIAVATMCDLFVSPFVSIAYAMLYLKLRQSGGESIDAMLSEQLGQQEIARAKWMRHMRRKDSSAARSGDLTGGRR